MGSTFFVVEEHFELAVLASVIYAFEMIVIGFVVPGLARPKVFTKEFMRENFDDEHKAATGLSSENSFGYPDVGYGRYSDKLHYQDWLYFAKAQRTHYNFLEQQAPQSLFIIIGAIKYPILSAILGFAFIIARLLYTIGYMNPGGSASYLRIAGALSNHALTVTTFILSVLSCIKSYT